MIVALAKRNINYFRKALAQHGVDPEQYDQEQGTISIFEKCCQRAGHGEYITACIQWGCDPNKVNLFIHIILSYFKFNTENDSF